MLGQAQHDGLIGILRRHPASPLSSSWPLSVVILPPLRRHPGGLLARIHVDAGSGPA